MCGAIHMLWNFSRHCNNNVGNFKFETDSRCRAVCIRLEWRSYICTYIYSICITYEFGSEHPETADWIICEWTLGHMNGCVYLYMYVTISIHIFWPFWAFFPPFESKFRIRTLTQLSMLKSFFVWRFVWHLFKIQWSIFVQNNKPTLTHFNGFAFCKSLLEKKNIPFCHSWFFPFKRIHNF